MRQYLIAIGLPLALAANPARAGQSPQPPDNVPQLGANNDNPSHPLGEKQNALRQRGLQAKLNGKVKGRTHEVTSISAQGTLMQVQVEPK